jgi:hypothetical protein
MFEPEDVGLTDDAGGVYTVPDVAVDLVAVAGIVMV